MKVKINARMLANKETVHAYLSDKFSFPDYYGENMDALSDCLGEIPNLSVEIINYDESDTGYASKIIRVIKESVENVKFVPAKVLDWNKYSEKAIEAAAEGCVLLKNDKRTLPLQKGCKVSVFGRIQTHYYKSGTGSGGMVNVTKVTGILDALRECGRVSVNEELAAVYEEWEKENPFEEGTGWGTEPWSQPEMILDPEVVEKAASVSETAIVIIGRTAGEDRDATDTPGSYRLSVNEEKMLEQVCASFTKTVVVLNVGNTIDMSFVDKYNPSAVLYVWQGGMLGGYGAERVLTGIVNPSGKLTDTIACNIKDYPCAKDFGSSSYNEYTEDIYVGYRYFTTFAPEAVAYPLGYGLSYTEFKMKGIRQSFDSAANKVSIRISVKNTGNVPGKKAVLIFAEAPQGELGKPARILADYGKTPVIQPNAKATVDFDIDMASLASFDDSGLSGHKDCFVLEEGEYKFYLGEDALDTTEIFSVKIDKTQITEVCSEALSPVKKFKRLRPGNLSGDVYKKSKESVPLLRESESVRRNEEVFDGPFRSSKEYGFALKEVLYGREKMEDFVAQFTDEDLSCMIRGEGMGSPLVTPGTASAFGGVSPRLRDFGIPAVCCDDGPSGMRLDCGKKAFSLPIGTLLACTYNDKLVEELYSFTGLEMAENKVEVLLGPGINIHRYPLNGRNFEYFSEDPLITGRMAASMLKGLHSASVTGCIKHFAANNQEYQRRKLDSRVSARALREIYLKPFEIAVKEGNADAVMTSYGSLNGLWTAGNYDLATYILRREWGFKGIVMTDWWATINERGEKKSTMSNYAAMVKSGNDLYMVCSDGATNADGDNTLESIKLGRLRREDLLKTATHICEFVMKTRAMDRLLGDGEEITIIGKPEDPEDVDISDVEFVPFEDGMEIDLSYKAAEKGINFIFALSMDKIGLYDFTVTGKSSLNELAQVPFTLYNTGIPVATFTFNGTGGEESSITKQVPIFNRFGLMRIYTGGNGVELVKIKVKFNSAFSKDYVGA